MTAQTRNEAARAVCVALVQAHDASTQGNKYAFLSRHAFSVIEHHKEENAFFVCVKRSTGFRTEVIDDWLVNTATREVRLEQRRFKGK